MSGDGSWQNLNEEQVALLSEGFCPWGGNSKPCAPGRATVIRGGNIVEYGHCFLNDALARITAGTPEVLPMEDITKNGWRLTECQT